jgi:2-isopropylmalate synthase
VTEHRYINIFDTTLRDGEQAPGATLNRAEKLEIARQLARLGVDIIEAGFPIASPDDFEAVKAIALEIEGPRIAGLARAIEKDITTAWDAVKAAGKPRIHTFISTSPVHMKYQIKKTPEEVLADTRAMVSLARDLASTHAGADVEFSAMDASRSEPEFLAQVLGVAVACGATTINVPDTVGYALPHEFGDFRAGATQVECAVNGIGERAGNASLEEVVMAIRTRGESFAAETGVETTEISRTSRLVSTLTGYQIQRNKAIVGRNAFAHESGIHQAGVLSEASTFEIMQPADVGLADNDIVLGKHSGRHALRAKLAELGYQLSDADLGDAFKRFKEVADKKKQVTVLDLEALVSEEIRERQDHFSLRSFVNQSGSSIIPTSQVEVEARGELKKGRSFSNGSVESVFAAIDDAVGISGSLADYQVRAISSGKDSLAEVRVTVVVNERSFNGQAVSFDVMEASAKAYVRAVNNAAAAGEV